LGSAAARRARAGDPARPSVVDLSIGQDAVISLEDWDVPATELLAGGPRRDPAGTRSIQVLPAARIPVEVQVVDRTPASQSRAGSASRRRRTLSAAGRPSRRDQPGVLRGHRRRPHPRLGRLCLCSRPVHHRAAAGRRRCRGRRRVRPGADADPARRGPLEPPRRARAGPDDRPARRTLGDRRHARPFPRPLDGPPAGGRRRRRCLSTCWPPNGATCTRT
jgi:hypothetical protein